MTEKSICFVSPFGAPILEGKGGAGGAERQFFLFGQALRNRGWEVAFIMNRIPESVIPEAQGFRFFAANLPYLGGSKWTIPSAWWHLGRTARQTGSRFILLKTPGHLLLPLRLALRHPRQLVFFGQTTRKIADTKFADRLSRTCERMCLKHCDIVLTQTREQADFYAPFCTAYPAIVPSIIATPTLAPCARDMDVFWCGNTTPNKRFDILVETARLLPGLRFAAAMNNATAATVARVQAMTAGLGNLTFLGELPPTDIEACFARARCHLNTSDVEGFPNTFLQAFYHGATVVSRRINPDGVLTNGPLGICTDLEAGKEELPVDHQAQILADALRTLLGDSVRMNAMRTAARAYVMSNHTPDKAAERLEQALLGGDA